MEAIAISVDHYGSAFKNTSHYTGSLALKPDKLEEWADKVASTLPMFLQGKRPLFCYSGMSGIAHATALSLAYYQHHGACFGMLYVRKPEERSHGSRVESNISGVENENSVLVFVDDFVSSGETRNRVIDGAWKFLNGLRQPITIDPSHYVQVEGHSINRISMPRTPETQRPILPSTDFATDILF